MQTATDFETAILRKYPECVAIVLARDERGKHNPITVSWLTRTSFEPPMMAVSIALTRYSLAAIRHSREFVVSLAAVAMSPEAVYFGSVSGRDVDKLAEGRVQTEPATRINALLLSDAVANFECVLEGELQTGDHVLLVGRVVASHMNADPGVRGLYALGNYRFGGVVPG